MFNPWHATHIEALQAQAAIDVALLGTPADPLVRWHAARLVEATRDTPGRLVEQLRVVLQAGLEVPEWLARRFLDECDRVQAGEARSWDQVFGRPLAPYARPSTARRALRIHQRVCELVARGRSVKLELFEEVGVELGAHASTVSRLYYQALRDGAPNPVAARRAERSTQRNSQKSTKSRGTNRTHEVAS